MTSCVSRIRSSTGWETYTKKKKKKRKKVEGRERENVRSELRYEYFRKVGKYGRLEVEVGHQWPRKIAGRVVGI